MSQDPTLAPAHSPAIGEYAVRQNAKLRDMLRVHVNYTKQSIKDIGGCDHSVGICCCDMQQDVDYAERLLGGAT